MRYTTYITALFSISFIVLTPSYFYNDYIRRLDIAVTVVLIVNGLLVARKISLQGICQTINFLCFIYVITTVVQFDEIGLVKSRLSLINDKEILTPNQLVFFSDFTLLLGLIISLSEIMLVSVVAMKQYRKICRRIKNGNSW